MTERQLLIIEDDPGLQSQMRWCFADADTQIAVAANETDAVAAVPIEPADLPAFCPNPQMPLWSSHPRVFLDIAETGVASCP